MPTPSSGTFAIVVGAIVALFLVCALAYGAYQINRWANWTFGYEDMVRETVREMVKEEALR